MKNFVWTAAIVVIVIAIMYWVINAASIKPPFALDAIHPLDNMRGGLNSPVLLVEYGDFGCLACRSYYFALKQLTAEFGDRITFIYRHFPLSTQANPELAARAAEAAGKQGKFWEMHDLLFEKQEEWSKADDTIPLFESYAALLGLNLEQFRVDSKSREVMNLVRTQKYHAVKSKLEGTPTFFLNGEKIENPVTVEEFKVIIAEALDASQ